MSKLKFSAQEGRALPLTLIALAFGCLLLPPFLNYISTNLLACQTTEEGMKEQYAADAGVEYGIWKLANDPVWVETLRLSASPVMVYPPTSINDIMVRVEVEGEVPSSWEGRFGGQTDFPGRLLDVHFINENVGWAVGEAGRILKTYDGGWTWFVQDGGTTRNLNSVFALSLTEVWAAGAQTDPSDSDTLLHTTDGGTNWQSVATPGSPHSLNSLFFVDATQGWAAGDNGKILFYNGTAWTDISPEGSEKLNSIFFLDEYVGWVVGAGGTILKTINGGSTWTEQDSGTGKDLRDAHFLDKRDWGLSDDRGWAVGQPSSQNSTIRYTSDGGTHWTQQTIENDAKIDFFGVHILDPNKGWMVGGNGIIRKTQNGGNTWAFDDSRTNLDLMAVYFLDTNHGWAVGEQGIILIYDGTVWKPQNAFTDWHLKAVWFVDNRHGWIVGNNGVIAAMLDGKEWITKTNSTVGSTDLFGVSFTSPYTQIIGSQVITTTGWIVGESGAIFKSSDAGDTWSSQLPPSPVTVNLNDVHVISPTLAFAVGDNITSLKEAVILKTTDGNTWTRPWPNTLNKDLHGVYFIDASTGWAVGESGLIIKTSDGGNTWDDQTLNADIQHGKALYDVNFIDANIGWVVGESEIVLKTTDGGANWITIPQENLPYMGPNPPRLLGVSFPDPNNGWIVGEAKQNTSSLFRTSDGGNNWELLLSGTSQDMHDIFVVDACHGWAVGDYGTILYFFCPPGQLTGACAIFGIESVANDLTTTSLVHLCSDGVHIASWEIQ